MASSSSNSSRLSNSGRAIASVASIDNSLATLPDGTHTPGTLTSQRLSKLITSASRSK
jgi:hypothetical protein